MRHPHVVAIHDVIERSDACAYAMEWIDGRSLAELIAHLASQNLACQGGAHFEDRGTSAQEARPPFAGWVLAARQRGRGSAIDPSMSAVRAFLNSPTAAAMPSTYTLFICHIGIAMARALHADPGQGRLSRTQATQEHHRDRPHDHRRGDARPWPSVAYDIQELFPAQSTARITQ